MRQTTPAGVELGFIYSITALQFIPDYAFTGRGFAPSAREGLINAPEGPKDRTVSAQGEATRNPVEQEANKRIQAHPYICMEIQMPYAPQRECLFVMNVAGCGIIV